MQESIIGMLFFGEGLHGFALTGVALSLLGIYGVSRPTTVTKSTEARVQSGSVRRR